MYILSDVNNLITVINMTNEIKDGFYPERPCSICGTDIGYLVENGKFFFDSNCDCVRYRVHPRPVRKQEFCEANNIPYQADEVRQFFFDLHISDMNGNGAVICCSHTGTEDALYKKHPVGSAGIMALLGGVWSIDRIEITQETAAQNG